jgi:hypothetical protein
MARIVLVVQPSPAGVSLTWSDGPAAFPPYDLSAKPLASAADAARRALGAVVGCFLSGEPGELPAAGAALADAGYALYQAVFKPGAEQLARAAEVRKWLDKLRERDAVESLEVVADGIDPIPWNLVYDRRPDPAAFRTGGDDPARWLPFWGIRYDLSCGRRVSPLRRFPVLNNPRVVVVTDPFVIDNLPDEARGLAELCGAHGWPLARSRAELVDALRAGRPDVLYWLGHTQAEPFGLVLGEDAITPDDLRGLMESDPFADAGDVFGGIAFLNACGTAQKEASGSFQDALHPLGLSGLIATEQTTIDTFAAPLGRTFLTSFAVECLELGAVMRAMRSQVPLGLVYGSYCPPVLKVRRTADSTDAKPGAVVHTRITSGTKLGLPGLPARDARPLPPHPYRSLRAYGVDDRALFAGRDDDVLRFARLVDDPGTRVLVLHGESGVGKTSFLRAGVIPFLETECAGFRFARDRSGADADPVVLVRATNDAVSQFASALAAACARPLTYRTPAGDDATADLPGVLRAALGLGADGAAADAVLPALRAALRADAGLLGRLLAELARAVPYTPVLVIDQAEEVFTLARTPADEANRALALEMLRRAAATPGGFKLIVSLRTEYHGRFVDRLRRGAGAAGVREYLLTDFGTDALVEVIRRPTATARVPHAAEVPFEKYRFRYADGVAEAIARTAQAYALNRQDSVLPLVQVVCLQLYDRALARPDRVIAAADLEAIGGVQGGMKRFAEEMVRRLFPRRADRVAFRRLLAGPDVQLFIRQPDSTLTTALLPAEFLARHWTGPTPFDQVLRTAGDGDWRLLRVNTLRIGDGAERPYVSLGHDALAHVAARWADEWKRRAHVRKLAAAVVALLAVAGGLFALSAWALEQRARATASAQKADAARAAADAARDDAVAAQKAAEGERARAEAALRTAEEERARADTARDEAVRARHRILKNYRDMTQEALEAVRASGRVGVQEVTFLEKARDRWLEYADRKGTDPRERAEVAEGHFRVALLLAASDRKPQALERYNLTCALAEQLDAAAHHGDPDHIHLLARARMNKGVLLVERNEWAAAEKEYHESGRLLDDLTARFSDPARFPDAPLYHTTDGQLRNNIGVLFDRIGAHRRAAAPGEAAAAFRRARAEFRRARDVARRLAAAAEADGARTGRADPALRTRAAALATYRKNLGLLCRDHWNWTRRTAGQTPDPEVYAEGRAELEAALAVWHRLAAEYKNIPDYRLEVLNAHNDLGVLLAEGGQPGAREHYDRARTIGAELVALDGNHPGYRLGLARCLSNLGGLLPDDEAKAKHYDGVIAALMPRPEHPKDDAARRLLCDAHRRHAAALEGLARDEELKTGAASGDRYRAAYRDRALAVELSPPGEKPGARFESLASLFAFSVGDALKEIDALAADPHAHWTPEQWYFFARMYGEAARVARSNNAQVERGDRALDLLGEAVTRGWADAARAEKDAADNRQPFYLIATRARFKQLCAEMAKKKAP